MSWFRRHVGATLVALAFMLARGDDHGDEMTYFIACILLVAVYLLCPLIGADKSGK